MAKVMKNGEEFDDQTQVWEIEFHITMNGMTIQRFVFPRNSAVNFCTLEKLMIAQYGKRANIGGPGGKLHIHNWRQVF